MGFFYAVAGQADSSGAVADVLRLSTDGAVVVIRHSIFSGLARGLLGELLLGRYAAGVLLSGLLGAGAHMD